MDGMKKRRPADQEVSEGDSPIRDRNAAVSSQQAPEAQPEPKVDKYTKDDKKVAKKPKKWLKMVIIAGASLLIVAVLTGVIWYNANLRPISTLGAQLCSPGTTYEDPDTVGYIEKEINIASGSSTGDIAQLLKKNEMIRDAGAFWLYVKLSGNDQLRAGSYGVNTCQSVPEIVDQLTTGPEEAVINVTFLPGGTLADAKKTLIKHGYKEAEIEAAFSRQYDHPVLAGKPAGTDLEGYIYGETYEFYKNTPVEKIIETCLDELYKTVQADNLIAEFQEQGLSLYQGIILSSIVQREGGDDLPGVASVFLNRLEAGMTLGSDVTYQYIADKLGVERDPALDNPYNTRIYPGLPPGPISSPGAKALLAVANPTKTDYLFFLSGDDGKTYFARTDAEHQRNIREHCQEKCLIL